MKTKLVAGYIEGALTYFSDESKQRYRIVYNIINTNAPGGIGAIAAELPVPIFVKIINNVATYVISRAEDGRQMEYTVYFIKDNYGIWKILEY